MSLMPCFDANQGQAECTVIGRMLTGYGELEVALCACHVAVEGILDVPVRDMFGSRGEKKRLNDATATLRPEYAKAGLEADLVKTLGDFDWCREIRNQYAHCTWLWDTKDGLGLCFANLEELANQPKQILSVTDDKHPISLALLESQEAFFLYVKKCLMHLSDAYKQWDQARWPGGITSAIIPFPKPQVVARPRKHD